jgi:uncharacterized protein with PIN domain
MTIATVHFHDSLQDLLRPRQQAFQQRIEFKGRQTIKHLVESLGVPHTEIGQLQAKATEIGFGYLVKNRDMVDAFPATPERDHLSGMFSNGRMVIPARFILDNHLGKLANDLRLLGIDALYSNQYDDRELAENAVSRDLILLSRDRQLLMRKSIQYGYLVRSLYPDEQLREILERFDLFSKIQLFERCARCNTMLEPVEKQEIEHRLEPLTKEYFFDFKICPGCSQIYWQGSHIERILNRLDMVLPGRFS